MAPLLKELSPLEVEPLEVIVPGPESEQDSCLNALTTIQGEVDPATFLTGTLPTNAFPCCCPCCCCQCCPLCCC
jgi:hypothetical protein